MLAEELKYAIKLSLLPGVGHVAAKQLVAYCGGLEAIFKQKKAHLLKIPGVGERMVQNIISNDFSERVEEELRFMESNNIKAHFYLEESYPQRLTHCEDSPILLFSKGNMDLNAQRMLAIVGTRNATVKGRYYCEQIIEDLTVHGPTIVSGLAYGIDIAAHRAALKNNLETIAVLASGLDKIYPKPHYNIAEKMLSNGGLVTDYMSATKMIPSNFVERNRIVAGMVDAVIVVESSEKGGSLITADFANDYHRDVFAVPGRVDDTQSKGCNQLVKMNKAALIESAKDIEYLLGWEKEKKKEKIIQPELFHELSQMEQQLLALLNGEKTKSVDELSLEGKMSMSETFSALLNLEFKGLVVSLPGKQYQLS